MATGFGFGFTSGAIAETSLTAQSTSATVVAAKGNSSKRGRVRFVSPNDDFPVNTIEAGSRGRVRFAPPAERALDDTAGAESRGRVRFVAPGEQAPVNTAGAGSRGRVRFTAPQEDAPTNTAGAGSRGRVRFTAPREDAPTNTAGAGSRGRVRFTAPREDAPTNTVGTGSREDILGNDAFAVLPPGNYTQTQSDRPSLMLYLPATQADRAFVSVKGMQGEFHYQTQVNLTQSNGILEVALPSDAPNLEVGQDYMWQVVLLAPEETLAPDTPVLQTLMSRVAPSAPQGLVLDQQGLTPAIALDYAVDLAKAGLWTDTLQVLADARRLNPGHADLEQEWVDLLTQVGLGDIASAPLLSRSPFTDEVQ